MSRATQSHPVRNHVGESVELQILAANLRVGSSPLKNTDILADEGSQMALMEKMTKRRLCKIAERIHQDVHLDRLLFQDHFRQVALSHSNNCTASKTSLLLHTVATYNLRGDGTFLRVPVRSTFRHSGYPQSFLSGSTYRPTGCGEFGWIPHRSTLGDNSDQLPALLGCQEPVVRRHAVHQSSEL